MYEMIEIFLEMNFQKLHVWNFTYITLTLVSLYLKAWYEVAEHLLEYS